MLCESMPPRPGRRASGGARPRRAAAGFLMLVAALVLAGCASIVPGPNTLIDASQLLATSGVATRSVTTAHFDLRVQGHPAGLLLRGAKGDLDAHGTAKGTATTVSASGTVAKVGFVLVRGDFYVQQPTGGYARTEPASAPDLFGLTSLLNPNHGLARLVQSLDQATTDDIESVNGVDCFRVTGRIAPSSTTILTPGLRSPSLGATIWVTRDGSHLPVRAEFTVPRSAGGGVIDLSITNVGTPVSATAPV